MSGGQGARRRPDFRDQATKRHVESQLLCLVMGWVCSLGGESLGGRLGIRSTCTAQSLSKQGSAPTSSAGA